MLHILYIMLNYYCCIHILFLFFCFYSIQAETMKSVKVNTEFEYKISELVTMKSYLITRASPLLFPTGRIKIICAISQFDLYKSSSEIELVDNAPPKSAQVIAPSLSPHSTGKIQLNTKQFKNKSSY